MFFILLVIIYSDLFSKQGLLKERVSESISAVEGLFTSSALLQQGSVFINGQERSTGAPLRRASLGRGADLSSQGCRDTAGGEDWRQNQVQDTCEDRTGLDNKMQKILPDSGLTFN